MIIYNHCEIFIDNKRCLFLPINIYTFTIKEIRKLSTSVASVTTHKYKWRFQEIFSVFLFLTIPIALWFLTPKPLFWSAGTIAFAIGIFLIYIGFARKNKSALTATVYTDGTVVVTGNGYEADKNKANLDKVTAVKWDKYAYHPTLVLVGSNGRTLKLPRRVATEEPLNTYIREHLSSTVYVVDEARATFDEIMEDAAEGTTLSAGRNPSKIADRQAEFEAARAKEEGRKEDFTAEKKEAKPMTNDDGVVVEGGVINWDETKKANRESNATELEWKGETPHSIIAGNSGGIKAVVTPKEEDKDSFTVGTGGIGKKKPPVAKGSDSRGRTLDPNAFVVAADETPRRDIDNLGIFLRTEAPVAESETTEAVEAPAVSETTTNVAAENVEAPVVESVPVPAKTTTQRNQPKKKPKARR
jgi:hypothetical protein